MLVTASSTPATLRSVRTLDDLVGTSPMPPADPKPQGRPLPGNQAVVIGDSTAAGDGLPPAANSSALDRACARSPDAYATALATVNGWQTLNLACDSATIENGLLGVRVLSNGQVAPAQFTEATRDTHAKVIIVSVGADDVQWSVMTQLCVSSTVCSDKASAAYYASLLGQFTRAYYQLLSELATLPAKPAVVVNEHYKPFGSSVSCLDQYHITAATVAVLRALPGFRLPGPLDPALRAGTGCRHRPADRRCLGRGLYPRYSGSAPGRPSVISPDRMGTVRYRASRSRTTIPLAPSR